MCDACGCGQSADKVRIYTPAEGPENNPREGSTDHDHLHDHPHDHDHSHFHDHDHSHGHDHSHFHDHDHSHFHDQGHVLEHHDGQGGEPDKRIRIEQDVLGRNNLIAERNRFFFDARNVLALNLVSSPGSGKTSLLERTIRELKDRMDIRIIEGDQQTMNDARRIEAAGVPVVQINTGEGCHLDADMIGRALKKLDIPDRSVLFIENVGNLVCPAMFDLGESSRIVVMSVTEGEDKPLKYPYMFRSSDLCIINKSDLLPYVDFDLLKAKKYALEVNRRLTFIELSVKTGDGMEQWYAWLRERVQA